MIFETFSKTLVNVLFVWISIPICNCQEYTAQNVDCNSNFQAASYNISSRNQCLSMCLHENCFYVKYDNKTCVRYGRNPNVASNGHVISDIYKKMALKNVARPGLNATQSSQYSSSGASYAIDGIESTPSSTNGDSKAWWMVDLGKNYYIVQIGFLILKNHLHYFTSMKIYLFDSPATSAEFPLQPEFASYPGPPTVNRFNISGTSPGMCGRYLVVQCEIGHPVELYEVAILGLDEVTV